jgi:hypothetical protein
MQCDAVSVLCDAISVLCDVVICDADSVLCDAVSMLCSAVSVLCDVVLCDTVTRNVPMLRRGLDTVPTQGCSLVVCDAVLGGGQAQSREQRAESRENRE